MITIEASIRPMYPKGLKSRILLSLFLILSGAMLLTDLVMISMSKKELLRSRLQVGQTLLAVTERQSLSIANSDNSSLLGAIDTVDASCLLLLGRDGKVINRAGKGCENDPALQGTALLALVSGEQETAMAGRTWGIVGPAAKYLHLARPFEMMPGKEIIGAVSMPLDGLYQKLRDSQRVFLGYFVVNLVFFSFLGFIRLYRGIVRPIDQLVETAEEFRDDEELIFQQEGRESEFNRLSRSLNQMISRIKRDRDKLLDTVDSLEKANLELKNAQREMVKAEKMASVGRLSAGIAHEIGNPIGIIIGYLDLLQQEGIDEEQRQDFIRRAEGEISRVNTIIRQLLDFARQPVEEERLPLDIHCVLEEVIDLCSVHPLMSGVNVHKEFAADNKFVLATNSQLKQIFLNLLLNAADAIAGMEPKVSEGRVMIRTFNSSGILDGLERECIQVIFIDNGPGISSADLKNIFDPFYTTKEPGKGTGLGLSICFTILEDLGGNIEASGGDEGGAVLRVTLPVTEDNIASGEKPDD